MKKRFLAILLCLSVLLMACACAAETMEPPAVSETESQAPAPQFTLSEVNAESSKTEEPAAPSETAPAESEPQETISMEESEIELEPVQPIEPIKPEEKETALEKVLTFKTGENGLVAYDFIYAESVTSADISIEAKYCADHRGNIYIARGGKLTCLNTGEFFSYSMRQSVRGIKICEENLYISFMDDTVEKYSLKNGVSGAKLAETYHTRGGSLVDIGGSEPILYTSDDQWYTLDGNLLAEGERPYVLESKEEGHPVSKKDGVPYTIYLKEGKTPAVMSCTPSGVTTLVAQHYVTTDLVISELLLSHYDGNGNLQSEFLFGYTTTDMVPCEISYPRGILTQYQGWAVTIGEIVFQNVLKPCIVIGPDGIYYAILYYADYGEIYKITPGYSEVTLSDFGSITNQAKSEATEATSVASSAMFAPASRAETEEHALRIIETPWTLVAGHKEERGGAELPPYLKDEDAEPNQTGIPYRWGGFNDREEFIALTLAELDGKYSRYMTGNVETEIDPVSGTIGLDCSGFVGLATGIRSSIDTKPHTSRFLSFGHEVSSLDELREWDIIVKSGHHVMFYSRAVSASDLIEEPYAVCWVYDVSVASNGQKTRERLVTSVDGYKFLHVYSVTYYDSLQHWEECDSCGQHRTYEPHTMELSESGHFQKCTGCDYMVALTPHTFNYTYGSAGHVATCTDCGYSVSATHSLIADSYDANGHTLSCSCGYTVTRSHTLSSSYSYTSTQHTRTCSKCGYSVSTAHTFTYTTYNLVKHRQTCSTCGYSALAPHLLGYSYDADGHWQECSLCSFKTASLAHKFADSRCTVCGCPQHMIMDIIAIPEEDEPLPVPEDQKATL